MSNSFSIIRHAIREMILSENYNVSIVGTPISVARSEEDSSEGGKKKPARKKRGESAPAEILSNFILTAGDLDDLISVAREKDVLRDFSENDVEIKRRIELIESRVSSTAAKAAALAVSKMTDDERTEYLFNMPGPDQKVSGDLHPKVDEEGLNEYPIPDIFSDLAMIKKPGGHGESIGRGEALAILMFGRDNDADKEPDLIVRGKGFSIKYFSNNSKTVSPGADLSATPAYSRIINLTMQLRKIAALKGIDTGSSERYISRGQVRNMLRQIDSRLKGLRKSDIFVTSGMPRADLDPSGIGDEDLNLSPTVGEIERMVKECAALWDGGLTLSGHNVIAMTGTANLKMYIVPKKKVVAGEIIVSGAAAKVAIASPIAGAISVTPGTTLSKEQAEEEAEVEMP